MSRCWMVPESSGVGTVAVLRVPRDETDGSAAVEVWRVRGLPVQKLRAEDHEVIWLCLKPQRAQQQHDDEKGARKRRHALSWTPCRHFTGRRASFYA
eukprot:2484976-Rhodomonas_salina.1